MIETLHRVGVRRTHLQLLSLGTVGLWIRAKTVDQDERGHTERRALLVGLRPPMFWGSATTSPSTGSAFVTHRSAVSRYR